MRSATNAVRSTFVRDIAPATRDKKISVGAGGPSPPGGELAGGLPPPPPRRRGGPAPPRLGVFRDAARSRLAAMISGERGDQVTVYLTAPEPHQLAGSFGSTAEARSAIDRAEIVDAPLDAAATQKLLGDLIEDRALDRVIFAGSRS